MSDTVDLLTDKEIADSFQAEGGIWSHVRATDRKPGLLRLFLDSSDVKADIEKQVWKVPRILGVSARCKGLSDHYLVVAVRFAFRQATLLKPNDHIVDWSHHNRVSIAQAYWRHAQLILSMASKEDALTLCRAHEAWSLKCRHVEVMKMRDNCTRWREKGPPWIPHSQQRSSRGGPSRKEPRSRGSIPGTDFEGSSNIHSSQYEKPGASIDLPQKRKLSPSAEWDIQPRPKNQPRLQFTSNRKSTPDDPLSIQHGPRQTPDDPLSAQHRPRPTAGNPLKSSLKPSNITRSRGSLDQRSLDNGLLAPENPPARPPSSNFDFTPPQPDQIASLKLKRFQNNPDQPQLEAFFSKPACSQDAEPRGWKKYIPGWRTE
ncbi:MAG: hypothetical protein LQ339_002437 [Xanthoria mediterranea]|nr:MAG: hypothetical protein LQ339_002437 [Xanthoria mediterranea]